ncbi:MAG: FtsK/SpoIIIE domain-containing protein [Paraclostridium sp.]
MKIEKSGNILSPLVDAVWEAGKVSLKALPFIWDKWGNLCYRIVEGRSYGTVVVEEGDTIETENIKRYEYIPVEPLYDISRKNNIVRYKYIEGEKEGIKIAIGEDLEGNNIVIDILDGNMLVGGMTGGGKSNLFNVIITNIIRTYTKNEVCIFGSDLASSDVYFFNRYDNFISISTTHREFLRQIDQLKRKIEERKKILNEANCRNVMNYNKKNYVKMSYIIFIVDELVQLTVNKECKEALHELMSNSRKYGVYWILGGQDATKETVGRCKMNCTQVVGFKTFDKTDSATLIGENQNLQDINIVGRCKVRNKNGIVETQIFYIEEEEIEAILKPFEKEQV